MPQNGNGPSDQRIEDFPEDLHEALVEVLREFDADTELTSLIDSTEDTENDSGVTAEHQDIELYSRLKTPCLFECRIVLRGVRPTVWRTFTVRSDVSLAVLSDYLTIIMGWNGSHLHHFRMPNSAPFEYNEPQASSPDTNYAYNEENLRLDQLVRQAGDWFDFDYDFGDGWNHKVTLVKTLPLGGQAPISLLDGANACPPDDCGGPHGYRRVLAALHTSNPSQEQLEILEWLGDDFAPTSFDAGHTRELLSQSAGFHTGYRDEVHRMVRRSAQRFELESVLYEGLDVSGPTRREIALMMRPFQQLIELVGDGVKLTQSGYLPPQQVAELIGKLRGQHPAGAQREADNLDVLALRYAATVAGFLRKSRNQLTVTKTGRERAADPVQLFQQLACRFPLERNRGQRDFALLMLVEQMSRKQRSQGLEQKIFGPQPPVEWIYQHAKALGWHILSDAEQPPAPVEVCAASWQTFQLLQGSYQPARQQVSAAALAKALLVPRFTPEDSV